ncbi:MAG TPA: hypothetical protein PLC06_06695 [Promineifilum sp.]|nr:hypothetical protein [Promineifilum sp.]
MIAALIVIVLWTLIIGIFLTVSRRQPDVQTQIKAVEERLDSIEKKSRS